VQQARLTHQGLGDGVGLRDIGQFLVEHAGEGEQVVALVLQRDPHRAEASVIFQSRLQHIAKVDFSDSEAGSLPVAFLFRPADPRYPSGRGCGGEPLGCGGGVLDGFTPVPRQQLVQP